MTHAEYLSSMFPNPVVTGMLAEIRAGLRDGPERRYRREKLEVDAAAGDEVAVDRLREVEADEATMRLEDW